MMTAPLTGVHLASVHLSGDHLMLDLETLGRTPGCAILSIGAVRFDPSVRTPVDQLDKFEIAIDPCSDHATIEAATVAWWLHNDRQAAREALAAMPTTDLYSALDGFAQWFGESSIPVWGNGSDFDNAILKSAFARMGMRCPWTYRDDRCFRTLRAILPKVETPPFGVGHSALSDAVWQVQHLWDLLGVP